MYQITRDKTCKHCGQYALFTNSLIYLRNYHYYVCQACYNRLYLSCDCCSSTYLKLSPKLKWLEEEKGFKQGDYVRITGKGIGVSLKHSHVSTLMEGYVLLTIEREEAEHYYSVGVSPHSKSGDHFLVEDLRHFHQGSGKICQNCITTGKYVWCGDCKKLFLAENCTYHDHLAKGLCKACEENNYLTCSFCDKIGHTSNIISDSNGAQRCNLCEDDVIKCHRCRYFHRVEDCRMVGITYYCMRCFSDTFSICDFCNESFTRDEVFTHDRACYCFDCGDSRELPTFTQGSNFIRGYSFKPLARFRVAEGDGGQELFGIELEVENVKGRLSCNKMAFKLFEIFKNFTYYKGDSSLSNGFEIVTHPFSWQWFINNKVLFQKGLKALADNGFESYKPATCGIHIHLSKSAFKDDPHLFKFLKIFYENFKFIHIISQRDSHSSNRSCQWGSREERSDEKLLLDKAKKKGGFERYTAVNLENPDTAEVRIFRGTLNVGSFFKNVEFVKACLEFSRVAGFKKVTVKGLKEFIREEQETYENLYKFLKSKGEM